MTAALSAGRTRLIQWRVLLPLGLGLALLLLVASVVISMAVGMADVDAYTVYESFVAFDGESFEHLVIRTVRLPRVLGGVVVGAGLAVAGAIMQGLTRNPLASPSILGVNAGATFAVVLAVFLLGAPPLSVYAWFAMLGATVAATIVYLLGSLGPGGATPVRLTLAGAIFTAFVTALTTALLVTDQQTLDQIRFWTVGSLAGREFPLLWQTAPYILVGLLGSLLLARQLTTLSLGESVAVGLGQNTMWVKTLAMGAVVLLAGGSVALAGPVGFVGLVVPHVARFLVGVDYRWILPYAAVLGALLVTVADTTGRAVQQQEMPVGVMLAFVGAPFFIFLARRLR